jgi:hypothetical protein
MNQFQFRKGRALLSTHANYSDAEDAALRCWLGLKPKGHDAKIDQGGYLGYAQLLPSKNAL